MTRTRALIIAAAIVIAGGIAAVALLTSSGRDEAAPSSSPSATSQLAPPSVADPEGTRACRLVQAAQARPDSATAPDVATLAQVVDAASASTSMYVQGGGMGLADALTQLRQAPDDPARRADVWSAATTLEASCISGRYYRPAP